MGTGEVEEGSHQGCLSGRDGVRASSRRISRCCVSEHFFSLDGAPGRAMVLMGTQWIDHASWLVICTMGESIYSLFSFLTQPCPPPPTHTQVPSEKRMRQGYAVLCKVGELKTPSCCLLWAELCPPPPHSYVEALDPSS